MMPLILASVWCAIHFTLFVALQNPKADNRERRAFLLHVVSFGSLSVLFLWATVVGKISVTAASGGIAVHGIYSLSILELWSLSEGSYSVAILLELFKSPRTEVYLIERYSALGQAKKDTRLRALREAGLIEGTDILH